MPSPSPSPGTTSSSDAGWISDPQPKLKTPRTQRFNVSGGLLTPPPSSSQSRLKERLYTRATVDNLQKIAFRAFNSQSQGLNSIDGFIAGSYVDTEPSAIPKPPEEDLYLKELERHLERYHTGTTPFISLSHKLLRVILLALRRSRTQNDNKATDWKIAVIKLSSLSSARPVWTLNAGRNARRAHGEWVAPPFYVDEILRAKNTSAARKAIKSRVQRTLTFADGMAFGRLLFFLGIPMRFVDGFCTTLLNDWGYPESLKQTWLLNEDFVQGRNHAYQAAMQGFQIFVPDNDEGIEERDCIHDGSEHVPEDIIQQSSTNVLSFAEFLAEVEDVAFGAEQPENAKSGIQTYTARGEKMQGESVLEEKCPEWLLLD
ncbi:MAG: hypothetical protein Q9219_001879 [cf. Caloplaca sp. 3 TL-2023]